MIPPSLIYTLQVCNYANDGIAYVAAVVNEDLTNKISVLRAWWQVAQGSCQNILSRNFEGRSWYELQVHADTKNYHWPAKKEAYTQRCLTNGVTARTITEGYNCKADEKQWTFSRFVINKGDGLETVQKYNLRR